MEKKYKNLMLVCLGIIVGVILAFSIRIFLNNKRENDNIDTIKTKLRSEVNKKNKEEKTNDNKEEKKEQENNLETTWTYTQTEKEEESNNNKVKNYNDEIINNNIPEKNTEQKDDNKTDDEVINYLETRRIEISENIKEEGYKEKAKRTFIEIVDFLFYGGTIKNHTFSELTGKAKLEAIKIAIKVEDKIEEYHPGMIEEMGSKYKNIKSKIVDLYTNKINEYCSNHNNLCSEVKKDYNNIKNTFNTTKNRISNFYQERIKE